MDTRFTPNMTDPTLDTITLERDGYVLVMGLDRPEKRNAFTVGLDLVDWTKPVRLRQLFGTADAAEGVQSFVERRPAAFRGC